MSTNLTLVETPQKRINRFWDANKKVPQDKRTQIAQDFIDELLTAGWKMSQLQKTVRLRHPSIRIKDKRRRFTVLDIVADFILNVQMVQERKREYPVSNAEAEFYREQQRKVKEEPILEKII